jgi:serine/threonine protein kinase
METIAGTKEYIAPEQAKFHNYTNAVDVWSLGIICDEILHGTPFYSGENNK